VKIYALVGKSGTGKSFQAMNLCREMKIDGIVDDGLFIYGGVVAAGISAKRQDTKVGAIRTALFTKEEHRSSVAEKIRQESPSSILILGTSDGMVEKIAERLELPPISKTIYIEDITTAKQREFAQKQRNEMGKHLIPAPTFQIKRDFSGYFLDPMRVFRDISGKNMVGERTVVRPTYSYRGQYFISDKVIGDIVGHIGSRIPGIASILRVSTQMASDGIRLRVLVTCRYGASLIDAAKQLQTIASGQIEAMTAFIVKGMDVEIRNLK